MKHYQPTFVLLFALLLGFIATACSGNSVSEQTAEPPIRISAIELYAQREANSERYDALFKGKTVHISGVICEIESGEIRLYADEDSQSFGVCFFDVRLDDLPTDVLAAPSVGDPFQAICEVDEYILGSIFLKDCSVPSE